MDAGQGEEEVCVQAAVGIRQMPGSLKRESLLVVNEDSNRLIFINNAETGVQEGCFTFDGVFSLDTGQDKLFSQQLYPLLARVSLGYSVSLLVCKTHCYEPQAELQSFVQKVIEAVLQETSPPRGSAQYLQTVSFVQVYTDGLAQDLLCPRSQALQVMDIPPLGLMVEEATEIVVADSQAATHFYLQGVSFFQDCLQKSFRKQHKAICGNLLTVTTEKEVESRGLRRATVRIFEFSGGEEWPSADPFLPLFWASSTVSLPAEAGFLPWILKHLLHENAFTFLLLCLTLPDASGEEILSALSLTEKVRAVAKRVAPTYWDPAQEAQKRRRVIGELRAQISSSRPEQDDLISQLGRGIKELQVLKSHNWEKKKETKAAYEIKETRLEAGGPIPSEMDSRDELENHLGSQLSQRDPQQEKEGGSVTKTHPGVQEGATEETSFTGAVCGTSIVDEAIHAASATSWSDEQHQDLKARFSLAKARRQYLQEQHRILIQQERLKMEEELADQEKRPPIEQEALHWQKEKALLTLRLEALQREQAEAERDLEEMYEEHRHEAETQKQHFLQVFQAYRTHAEEQMNALEQRYRKLLQESLQDAIILSTQNQQFRAQRQTGCMDRAAQTDFQPLS